jgi:hypothetical protein
MFDDIYKKKYFVIVIANKIDLLMSYGDHHTSYLEYFKKIFGDDTIVIPIPRLFNFEKTSDLLTMGKMILRVESTQYESCEDDIYLWNVEVKR